MITSLSTLAIFLFGTIIGSFLNVVAIRVLKGESISYPPSHCVNCNYRLKAYDLIPVLSFLWLRGKCRSCRQPISYRYPLGELSTGLLFAVAFLTIGYQAELVAALFFISILIIITQTDLQSMLIPNSIVIAGLIGGILIRLWIHPYPLWNHLGAMFVGSGILLLLGVVMGKLLQREAMGGGDIKLYAFIGLMIGIPMTLLSLFLASVLGLLIMLPRRKHNAGGTIPFGPFIAGGALIAYLWGQDMVSWYIGLLNG